MTLTSRPFLSERPTIVNCPYQPQFPDHNDASVAALDRAERVEQFSAMFFSPKFLLHLTIVIGITLTIAEPFSPVFLHRHVSNKRYVNDSEEGLLLLLIIIVQSPDIYLRECYHALITRGADDEWHWIIQ